MPGCWRSAEVPECRRPSPRAWGGIRGIAARIGRGHWEWVMEEGSELRRREAEKGKRTSHRTICIWTLKAGQCGSSEKVRKALWWEAGSDTLEEAGLGGRLRVVPPASFGAPRSTSSHPPQTLARAQSLPDGWLAIIVLSWQQAP